MKSYPAMILAGLAAAVRLAAATPDSLPQAQAPSLDAGKLVRALADERFHVRENASRDLWKLGEAALPALQEAAASPDPEMAYRARDLLRKIQLHITPDTDPSVASLVERYLKASPSEKASLLGRMRAKRAWRQMLKLYAAEKQPEVREKLSPAMEGAAISAARERLLQGDAPGAREFLEMAPAEPENLLALADFHRAHGSLNAEIDRAKAAVGRQAALWRLALERCSGNLPAATAVATAAGEPRLAAALAAMDGDPLPWLREFRESPENAEPVAAAYAALAAKRWLGQPVRAAELDPLTRRLASRNVPERGAAMNALFLLGETDAAEPAFAKAEPLSAFRHFLALERLPEALTALGLDPQQPDYRPWVAKKLGKFKTNDVEDQHEASTVGEELVALANFLESKGRVEDAFAAFSEPLAALAEKDEDEFLDFLGSLFGNQSETQTGAPRLARRIGTTWAGDDDNRWNDLVTAAFGDEEPSREWWDWLSTLDPRADRAERFDAMLALHGVGPDPARRREHWLALAWKDLEKAPVGVRPTLAARISTLAIQTGDASSALRAWDLMSEEARQDVFWGQRIVQLSALDRWNDAANVILARIADVEEAKQDTGAELHAYAAAALRRAGRAAEAADHDSSADTLALGSAPLAIRIGNAYAYGADYPRASQWWARATCLADPDSGEFALALKLHADALLEQGRWKECASIAEVISRIYAASDLRWTNPLPFMRQRLQADTTRALANLKTRRAESLAVLEKSHRTFASDGSLADFFFPALRKVGLIQAHDRWFRQSWNLMQAVIRRYPDSDNTCNTAAWFAARAARQLDAAETLLNSALAAHPDQPAYLDTMAEIHFARGNREKALEWSRRAVNFSPDDPQLRRQQERFRADPFP